MGRGAACVPGLLQDAVSQQGFELQGQVADLHRQVRRRPRLLQPACLPNPLPVYLRPYGSGSNSTPARFCSLS